MGIGTSGAGLGSFVLPPLIAFLFNTYAFQGGLLVFGAINFHLFLGSFFYRPLADNYPNLYSKSKIKKNKSYNNTIDDQEIMKTKDENIELDNLSKSIAKTDKKTKKAKSPLFHFSLCKDVRFLFFSMALIFTSAGATAIVFLAPICREFGFDMRTISIIVAVHGASDMIGRFLLGFLLDSKCLRRHKSHVFYVVVLLCGLSQIALPFARSLTLFFPVIIVRGICITMIGQKITIISDFLDRDKIASANGFASLNQGIGFLIGPVFGGNR